LSGILYFDTETDGLIPQLTKIHCIVTRTPSGDVEAYHDHADIEPRSGSLSAGLDRLSNADVLIAHNGVEFDVPAIQKCYPDFRPKAKLVDTLVLSRLIWPDIRDEDWTRIRRGGSTFPTRFAGSHSLKAWGHRLGVYKGDFGETSDWSTFSADMLAYCIQDTAVLATLADHIEKKKWDLRSVDLEHRFAHVIAKVEQYGFRFDIEAARALCLTLISRRHEIDAELLKLCPPRTVEYVTPKKKQKKTRVVEFNPASRDMIAQLLTERYGWKPRELTSGGKPVVDESSLVGLEWPEAKLLNERFIVAKRLGQLAEGKQAWMTLVQPDGRIHGRMNHNGAVTGRSTHSNPNMAQAPRANKSTPYGIAMRSLFVAGPGKVLVGIDAKGLELRCLSHFIAKYDGGTYAKVVCEGDPHTDNMLKAGLTDRDKAKTFIYALMYGAGDEKLGSIVGKGAAAGKALRAKFLGSFREFAQLLADVKHAAKARGTLRGMDGRLLHVRAQHAALNTLLQHAGAAAMKLATVLVYETLTAAGYVYGKHWGFCAHVHDEMQIECDATLGDTVGKFAVAAIEEAAKQLGFRCPLTGEYKIGRNWAETH
jgi:DNA polymerase I-like protein with 3'-5' exonuclease and polymerase domains